MKEVKINRKNKRLLQLTCNFFSRYFFGMGELLFPVGGFLNTRKSEPDQRGTKLDKIFCCLFDLTQF